MRLVVAEKPELARNIARAMCGAPDGVRLPYRGDPYTVVACAGHLMELEEPADMDPGRWGKPWREEQLPICPHPWPKVIAKGKDDLVRRIGELVSEADEVIHAGDPDDEGQLIVDELLDHLGYEGPVRRVLVNDSIDKNIRRAFERMDDNASHVGAGRAALARQVADLCFGVNESRLATLRAARGTNLSIGRVQTPTLGLIVRRDREIAAHKAVPYLTLAAQCLVDGSRDPVTFAAEPDKSELDEAGRLSDEARAKELAELAAAMGGEAMTSVEAKAAPAPLPFNLTTLTEHMSKTAKMGAERVMRATQSLRDDHRAITYNRTDCSYLPTEAFADAEATLARAAANLGESWQLDFTSMPKCFDDSKIDAHTGIVPQDIEVDLSSLGKDERLVYQAVCERYAMQFAGDERFEVSTTRLEGARLALVHKARRRLEAGWRSIAGDEGADKGFQPGWLDAGSHQVELAKVDVARKRTKPRRPYTEGTLVKDMASCARYLKDPRLKEALRRKDEGKPGEHGSIGTTASRPDVIEKLKARGYVTESRGYLVSTRLGQRLFDACPPEIREIDLTARWWLMQERVAAGEEGPYAIADDVVRVFEAHRDTAWRGVELSRADAAEEVATCPVCGSPVVDKGPKAKSFQCSSNKWVSTGDGERATLEAGCGFSVYKVQFSHRLTHAQARALIERGRTGPIKGLKGKSGKPFEARLVLEDVRTGKVGVEFEDGQRKRGAARGRGARG